jgi:hypothetical protein
MTWHNTPCAPTLAAFSEACPKGWAEIEFTCYAGNPTADPPQDADCSIQIRRLWGIENSDEPALADLLDDLREPPLAIPTVDFTLLARMVHRAGPCNTCGRTRKPDDSWACAGDDEENFGPGVCPGMFPFESRLEVCWGPEHTPVYFLGHNPIYPGSA